MSNPWKLLFIGLLVCGSYSISSANSGKNVPVLVWKHFLGHEDINNFENLIKSKFNHEKYEEIQNTAKFMDFYYQNGDNLITINKLHLLNLTTPKLTKIIVADNSFNALKVTINLGDVNLVGEYTAINTKMLELLPIQQQGFIEFNLRNVTAVGLIGINHLNGNFITNNVNLKYLIDEIDIHTKYPGISGKKIYSQISKSNIDETVAKSFKNDLFGVLQRTIKKQLNDVLMTISVHETFASNLNAVENYVEHQQNLKDWSDIVVDGILHEIKNYIQMKNMSKIDIPDYNTTVSSDWGFITLYASILAKQGYAGNLATLERKGHFTITKDNNKITLFGNVGLKDLNFGFNYYKADAIGIVVDGVLHGKAGENVIQIEIQTENIGDIIKGKFTYDLKVTKLENIEINATGLAPFNGLFSSIVTWVSGLLKNDIIPLIEQDIKDIIDKIIKHYLII